jgi:hypothetical protein
MVTYLLQNGADIYVEVTVFARIIAYCSLMYVAGWRRKERFRYCYGLVKQQTAASDA